MTLFELGRLGWKDDCKYLVGKGLEGSVGRYYPCIYIKIIKEHGKAKAMRMSVRSTWEAQVYRFTLNSVK
jgi:hypothetical protein